MLLVRSIATHNITAKMCYLTMYPRKIKYFPYVKKNLKSLTMIIHKTLKIRVQ